LKNTATRGAVKTSAIATFGDYKQCDVVWMRWKWGCNVAILGKTLKFILQKISKIMTTKHALGYNLLPK